MILNKNNRQKEARYTNKITNGELAQIKTICVLCWGLIGDVLIRVSLLEALKERFPESKLTVVVDPPGVVALKNHPDVDELVLFSRKKRPFLKYIYTVISKIRYLRRKKFDLSINLYSGGASPRIIRLINAKNRLGFNHTKALRKSNNWQVDHPDLCTNWTIEIGTVLLPLGIHTVRRGTSFYCNEQELSFADNWLSEIPKKHYVINLAAGVESKIWATHKFVSLAEMIQQKYNYYPIILSNPGQTHLVEQFRSIAADETMYSVLPITSFGNVAAIIKKSDFIITGDTSIMHMAFGLKCPTLGIFTQTRPEIVDPEDSIHIACFKEGRELDSCGQKMGTQELSADYCFSQFEKLITVLEKS